jgi:hypothetical protein
MRKLRNGGARVATNEDLLRAADRAFQGDLRLLFKFDEALEASLETTADKLAFQKTYCQLLGDRARIDLAKRQLESTGRESNPRCRVSLVAVVSVVSASVHESFPAAGKNTSVPTSILDGDDRCDDARKRPRPMGWRKLGGGLSGGGRSDAVNFPLEL